MMRRNGGSISRAFERKPEGKVCVITAEKLQAMGWSCAVTPWTRQAEDAAIVAKA
jgi:hypothetical protein